MYERMKLSCYDLASVIDLAVHGGGPGGAAGGARRGGAGRRPVRCQGACHASTQKGAPVHSVLSELRSSFERSPTRTLILAFQICFELRCLARVSQAPSNKPPSKNVFPPVVQFPSNHRPTLPTSSNLRLMLPTSVHQPPSNLPQTTQSNPVELRPKKPGPKNLGPKKTFSNCRPVSLQPPPNLLPTSFQPPFFTVRV